MSLFFLFTAVSACLFTALPAFAKGPVGYRVMPETRSLYQVARDVYRDERAWQQIADWNGLQPPYNLKVGQVLVLKKQPVVELSKNNLAPLSKNESREVASESSSSTDRDLKNMVYTVNERAPSLRMVALELYGDPKFYKEIASWNKIPTPYTLKLGQQLKLKTKPTRNTAQGTALLVDKWATMKNLKMVRRLARGIASTNIEAAVPRKQIAKSSGTPKSRR